MSRGCQIEVIFFVAIASQELFPLDAGFHSNTDCPRRDVVLASAFRGRSQAPLAAPSSFPSRESFRGTGHVNRSQGPFTVNR